MVADSTIPEQARHAIRQWGFSAARDRSVSRRCRWPVRGKRVGLGAGQQPAEDRQRKTPG